MVAGLPSICLRSPPTYDMLPSTGNNRANRAYYLLKNPHKKARIFLLGQLDYNLTCGGGSNLGPLGNFRVVGVPTVLKGFNGFFEAFGVLGEAWGRGFCRESGSLGP